MRTAALLAALALSGVFAACSRREPQFEDAVLPLQERLDGAHLGVATPRDLGGRVEEVLWVREGLACIVVRLGGARPPDTELEDRALWYWRLPIPPATPRAASDLPEFLEPRIPRLDPGPAGGTKSGFRVQDDRLSLFARADLKLPKSLRLRYVVHAARLAGTALAAGYGPRELLGLRAQDGDRSYEAIALPTGATLRFTLPPVPEGRLELAFRAVPAGPEAEDVVELELSVAGRELFTADIPTGAPAIGLGREGRRHVQLEASKAPRAIEIVTRGAPGGMLLVEAPLWARPRRWSDGPNVLLVLVDGLRADRVGLPGDSLGVMPALDRFALDAVHFQDAWAASSWCLPSLATTLTSTYSTEHQATRKDRRLGRGVTTVAEVFRGAGYRTAAVTDGGFAAPDYGVDRGFTTFDARARGVDAVAEAARAFLSAAGDGPWLLLLHTRACTGPYTPPPEADAEVRRRHPILGAEASADPMDYVGQALERQRVPAGLTDALRELYDAEARSVDLALGALLADLRARSDYRDGCVVAVAGGHGEEFEEHGFLGHGTTLFPEVLRVPLLVKLPGLERASTATTESVSLLDLAPTLVQAAGLAPRLVKTTFSGVPLFGGGPPSPIHAQLEHPGPLAAVVRSQHLFVQGPHALQELRQAPNAQLFSLVADPGATQNMAQQQRSGAQVLANWIERLPEQYPPRTEEIEAAIDGARLEALHAVR